MIIGIDWGLDDNQTHPTAAYAVCQDGDIIDTQSVPLPTHARLQKPSRERFWRLKSAVLLQVIADVWRGHGNPRTVFAVETAFRGRNVLTYGQLMWFGGQLDTLARLYNNRLHLVTPNAGRTLLCGSARATDAAMLAAARGHYPVQTIHEADAVGIALAARAAIGSVVVEVAA